MKNCPSIDYVIKGEGEFSMLEFSFNLFHGKEAKNIPGIILSGHTDVVPASPKEWSSDPYVAREKDNKIFGKL